MPRGACFHASIQQSEPPARLPGLTPAQAETLGYRRLPAEPVSRPGDRAHPRRHRPTLPSPPATPRPGSRRPATSQFGVGPFIYRNDHAVSSSVRPAARSTSCQTSSRWYPTAREHGRAAQSAASRRRGSCGPVGRGVKFLKAQLEVFLVLSPAIAQSLYTDVDTMAIANVIFNLHTPHPRW